MAKSNQPGVATPETSISTDAVTNPAQVRLLDLARIEDEHGQRVRTLQDDMTQRALRLAQDMPPLFLRLAQAIREAMQRYNSSIPNSVAGPALSYRETPAVSSGKAAVGHELYLSLWRRADHFDMHLHTMTRAQGQDVPIIEGWGDLGRDYRARVTVRIDGWIDRGQTIFWLSIDGRRVSFPLEELPERIVMAVARGDATYLWRDLAPPQKRVPRDDLL